MVKERSETNGQNRAKTVLVIGGGPGGYVAAIRAAQLGAAVTLVEKEKLGGTCLNRGCIPTKCLLRSAELIRDIREHGAELGVRTKGVEVDFPQIIAHKNQITKTLTQGVGALLKMNGVTSIQGEAVFTAPKTVEVTKPDGVRETMTPDAVIIAAGSGNAVPPIPGIKENPCCIDSTRALSLETLPKTMVIIGGGDTGNDCQGTALRQGCTDLVALEMMPQPPKERAASNPWPEWPRVLKVDYGQTECLAKFNKDPRIYQTTVKEFLKDDAGNLTGAVISYLKPECDPETGRTRMVPTGEEFTYDCQLAFIAAGFTGCESYVADAFGVDRTPRGNVADQNFKTNVDKVFVCGDMRRGQSLVVWGLREGRDCAAAVDRYLMGYTNL